MSSSSARTPLFLAGLLLAAGSAVAWADEFTDMAANMGTVTTIMGTFHFPVNDANGIGINFWQSSYEGGPASAASLSGPHIANADAFGNLYIADKFSHAQSGRRGPALSA